MKSEKNIEREPKEGKKRATNTNRGKYCDFGKMKRTCNDEKQQQQQTERQ